MVSTPRPQVLPAALLITIVLLLLNIQLYGELVKQLYNPINGIVQEHDWHYYYVDPNLFSSQVANFAVTPLSGEVYMYVSTKGQPSLECENCVVSSPSLFVSVGGESWPVEGNIFIVGVYGNTVANFTFNLWGNVSVGHINLINGQPQHGYERKDESTYFKYKVTGSIPTKLYVSVCSQDGDPDLYVSGSSKYPTDTNYDYSSRKSGTDYLTIELDETSPKEFWIGVFGFATENRFTITVTQTNTTTLIAESLSTLLYEDTEMRYFVYNNLVLQTLNFNLKRISTPIGRVYIKFGSMPTENDYDRVIRVADPLDYSIPKNNSNIGNYYVGIKVGKILITVTSLPYHILLEENVPVNGTVAANQLNYYQHDKVDDTTSTITVTVFFGRVKWFISTSTERPNQYVHTRSFEGIVGQPSQFKIQFPQKIKLSVLGEGDSSYMLTYTDYNPPRELFNGIRFGLVRVANNRYKYHTFKIKQEGIENTMIMFVVSTPVGSVDLYINTGPSFPSTYFTWYTWNTIIIPGNDKRITSNEFRIAVEGDAYQSYYSIMALQFNKTVDLSNDKVVSSNIEKNNYHFYQFPLGGSVSLSISIESDGPLSFFYSTTNSNPTAEGRTDVNGSFKNSFLVTGAFLYISLRTYSTTPISYQLKVNHEYKLLQTNQISYYTDSIERNETRQFKLDLARTADKLSFSLSRITGATIMYISNDCQPANETHYNWKIDDENQYGQVLLLTKQAPGCYYVGVYGQTTSEFKLSALLNGYFIHLGETVLLKASTEGPFNIIRYYERKRSDYLVLNIKAVSGFSNISIAEGIDLDSSSNSIYFSNGDQDRSLILPTQVFTRYDDVRLSVSISSSDRAPIVQLSLDMNICYGKIPSNGPVCSGNGKCVGNNDCICVQGYFGEECSNFKCFDIIMSNKTVCSSRGTCTSPNKCECEAGFVGNSCEFFTCNGMASNDERVCSRNGFCSSLDNCDCDYGYFGSECEQNLLCATSKDYLYCSNAASNETELNIVPVQNINNHLTVNFEKYDNINMALPSTISEYVHSKLGQTLLSMASSVIPAFNSSDGSIILSPIVDFALLQNGTTERIEITNLKEPIHLYMHNISIKNQVFATGVSCAFYDSIKWNTDNVKTVILSQIEQGEATILSVSCSSNSWTSSVAMISQPFIPVPPPPPGHQSAQQSLLPKEGSDLVHVDEKHNYYYLIGLALILIMIVIVIIGVVAFIIYRRKKKASMESVEEKKENYNNINYANLKEEEA